MKIRAALIGLFASMLVALPACDDESTPVKTNEDRLMMSALKYEAVLNSVEGDGVDFTIEVLLARETYRTNRPEEGYTVDQIEAVLQRTDVPVTGNEDLNKALEAVDKALAGALVALKAGDMGEFKLNEATLLKALVALRDYRDARK